MAQKYVWGAGVWHTVYGTGLHKATRSTAYVCSCGVTIMSGSPSLVDPQTPPAKMCHFCKNLTAAQLQTLRDKILRPDVASVNSNPTFGLNGKVSSPATVAPAKPLTARSRVAAARR